jgi:hypothetical protein
MRKEAANLCEKTKFSEAGKKGAETFWKKYYTDPEFREKMRKAWEGHRVNRKKLWSQQSWDMKLLEKDTTTM